MSLLILGLLAGFELGEIIMGRATRLGTVGFVLCSVALVGKAIIGWRRWRRDRGGRSL